jgi:hypothetical protein
MQAQTQLQAKIIELEQQNLLL